MSLLEDTLREIKGLNRANLIERENHINSLLKTPKGLGRLEDISIQLAGINPEYRVNKKAVVVMAADNGVEVEGVSASKRVITQYVVKAMLEGKASISSLAKTTSSDVYVVDLGIDTKDKYPNIIDRKIMKNGTNNIRIGEAMSRAEAVTAIETGIEICDNLVADGYNLFAIGEMGIGNTTTSSAILKVLTDLPYEKIVGRGSGIDDKKLLHKIQVIKDAIAINNPDKTDPIDIIQKVGGLDIAAMTGAFLSAGKNRIPIVIDGLISGVAALLAYEMNPNIKEYMFPSHLSEEPGAEWIMERLGFEPMMYMKMKLGEGSGAILMFPIIEAASNLTRDIMLYPDVD